MASHRSSISLFPAPTFYIPLNPLLANSLLIAGIFSLCPHPSSGGSLRLSGSDNVTVSGSTNTRTGTRLTLRIQPKGRQKETRKSSKTVEIHC